MPNLRRRRPRAALLLAAVAAILVASVLGAGPAEAGTRISGTQLQLLARLKTAPEHSWGYARTRFPLWIDADGDGCTTRYEVLIAESTQPVTIGAGCYLRGGKWYSAYDGTWTTNPSTFDIDHMVPLKEAWDSGAWRWTTARRRSYANDLGSGASLRAVSASSNRSKGDKDPAQWLPPRTGFRCTYAAQWVATKVRWGLNVDAAERRALSGILAGCSAHPITVVIV
ncbi:MAG: HNH endonuclease family protein [Chloroflexota bacterium]